MQKYLITGNSDLLPKANKTPKGNANIIPKNIGIIRKFFFLKEIIFLTVFEGYET